VVLKGTTVNGVFFDCHPRNDNVTLDRISFREVVSRGVASMDTMALAHCEENGIPGWYFLTVFFPCNHPLNLFFFLRQSFSSVVVFNMLEPGNVSRALCGDQVGTLIDQTGRVEHQLPS